VVKSTRRILVVLTTRILRVDCPLTVSDQRSHDGMVAESLEAIALLQRGVISRHQALANGTSDGMIRHAVDTGRWQRVHPGIFATFSGELSREALLWAALLHAGRMALLSHETAAELQGMADRRDRHIHVSVPKNRRVVAVRGVRVHISSTLADCERYRREPGLGMLGMTWPEDTLLDLIHQSDRFDDVCGWITRAVSRHVVIDVRLRAFMAERHRLRWRDDVAILLDEAINGTDSPLEYRWDHDVERSHGLPRSVAQRAYVKPEGGRGFRDRLFADYRVIVELDGNLTHPVETRWQDRERDNYAAGDDLQTLRFGWREVRPPENCKTAALTAAVLRNHGWQGTPFRCGSRCGIPQREGSS
jgi:AbiEi antitoxin C-terminal domain